MTNHGITSDNLMRTLPIVLQNDDNMRALAQVIADTLSERKAEIDRLRIYTQIDNLPEPLLDILAYDFKVDWYGYNFSLAVKRAQIKDTFRVHRKLGTRGATEKALNDIYPGTEVEEWFEYGDDPYFFRVLLDVTNQQVSIAHDEIIRTIDMFKPIRSHLQSVIYRSRARIGIGVATGYVVYNCRLCGTYPAVATQGGINAGSIVLNTDASGGGTVYTAKPCGTSLGGLF